MDEVTSSRVVFHKLVRLATVFDASLYYLTKVGRYLAYLRPFTYPKTTTRLQFFVIGLYMGRRHIPVC